MENFRRDCLNNWSSIVDVAVCKQYTLTSSQDTISKTGTARLMIEQSLFKSEALSLRNTIQLRGEGDTRDGTQSTAVSAPTAVLTANNLELRYGA
ncbi:uncharacterized protein MYCFIDRAFT_173214 [Pseudocercospora fijiensis CIRAD86]|uniref:Uncharacterized protein n=1 Tax=Pseudocercospora fijiensis (strain CIRAD86) TaxID=383855 RepID=M2Z2V3_PSEFD|nr:uncharacterized protein MYCFIDRAFT_173214 [Pseudocercospora fijiensis CIRAD86]EME84175.1 hypothetical protein MYCFIDRAFT_173214 [Pseudocercospora fijiensis CIRAD86]